MRGVSLSAEMTVVHGAALSGEPAPVRITIQPTARGIGAGGGLSACLGGAVLGIDMFDLFARRMVC